MNEDGVQQTEEQPQTRRGRPPRGKTRRKFAAELADLQGRVDMAVRVLKRAPRVDMDDLSGELINVAIDTLTGKKEE